MVIVFLSVDKGSLNPLSKTACSVNDQLGTPRVAKEWSSMSELKNRVHSF